MEKPFVSILGQAQQIEKKHSPCIIRDPFGTTMQEFIRFCVGETVKALHVTVVHTYQQLPTSKAKHFFLMGYKPRTGWNALQQKVYGDPSNSTQGFDIKWLLKNLRWHWRTYAAYMNLYDDVFEDITGFLLFDIVQNGYVEHDRKETELFDESLVRDCFEACLELVSAISEATFYKPIAEDVVTVKHSIEVMFPMLTEFISYRLKQVIVKKAKLDTHRVIKFLKSNELTNELKKEEKIKSENPADKPLTNFFLFTVMPRFEHDTASGNSEIVQGDLSNTPDKSMDSSLIIIDRFQSTPVVKNKVLDELKEKTSAKHSPGGRNKVKSSSDQMDGSFILL